MTFIKTVSIVCAFALLCACSQIVNRAATVLAPSVTLTEMPLEGAGAIPRDAALVFITKRLNATQYGIVLEDIFSRGAKPFDFGDLYLKLQEKTTQDILRTERIYIVALISTCADQDAAGSVQEFYAKNYLFTSPDEAQQVCAALLALGVRQCCDEGCDEEPPGMENP